MQFRRVKGNLFLFRLRTSDGEVREVEDLCHFITTRVSLTMIDVCDDAFNNSRLYFFFSLGFIAKIIQRFSWQISTQHEQEYMPDTEVVTAV